MAAIFFDIDGTLWDRDSIIPDSTVQAVRLLKENGHLTFLCSGRSRSMIFGDNLFALGMDGILAGCGTYIEYRGEELYNRNLPQELLWRTIGILQEYHLPAMIEGSQGLFMEEGIRHDPYGAYLMRRLPDRCRPVNEETRSQWTGNKLTVLIHGCDPGPAIRLLQSDYEVLRHGDIVMELVPKGFSKATGIQKVCALLHIPHEDTYSVGDSVNDADMLRYAAHGIAMGNGTDAAKEAADYVTGDLHEDGLYNAMAHFGLL